MEAAIQLLRSNYVYRQVFRSIGENFENYENWDPEIPDPRKSTLTGSIIELAQKATLRNGSGFLIFPKIIV